MLIITPCESISKMKTSTKNAQGKKISLKIFLLSSKLISIENKPGISKRDPLHHTLVNIVPYSFLKPHDVFEIHILLPRYVSDET